MHRLEKELLDLVQSDPDIFTFVEQSSLDGMWYWDLEQPEQEWMSEKFWTTLGYDPQQRKHLASEWQDLINQDDLAEAFSNFEKHCADPNYPYEQTVRYKHSNGSTVWVRCRGKAIFNKQGKAVRMFGAHVDITAEKDKEIQLRQTLEARERFFARMSHEIRTPLHGMIGLAENLKHEHCDPDTKKQLQTMLDCGEQLQSLLDDLLTVSKIDNDKFTCSISAVSIANLLNSVQELFASKARQKQLKLILPKLDDFTVCVYTDKTRLIQILSNLLSNAIKFTEKGQIELSIKQDDCSEQLRISIIDTGIGIKDTESIFDAYRQEEIANHTKTEGTGLGLEIVQKLCRTLGHKFELSSDLGVGTRVDIWLQLASNTKPNISKTNSASCTIDKLTEGRHSIDNQAIANNNINNKPDECKPKRVLIVDDNELNREIVTHMLQGKADIIDHAENGRQAVDKVIANKGYDFILMDLNMPVMNGYQAATEIKLIENTLYRNQIIAVTADTDQLARDKCKSHGIETFLAKPFTRETLFGILQ